MDSVLMTLSIAGGVTGLLATLVTVPFSPARFWSWRLRKHMETVKALDADRHRNQHEVLMRRADVLASKAAAAYQIPMDPGYIRLAVFSFGWFAGLIGTSVWLYLSRGWMPWTNMAPVDVMGLFIIPLFLALDGWVALRGFRFQRRHRQLFIARGCPPDYPQPRGYRQLRRDALSRDDGRIRARRMRRAGAIPEDWRPRNRMATMRRQVSAWSRNRPWYRGGVFLR
ncbi:hypothetical protein BH11ACT6_BH11ACT6_29910 [soil metagenome]